MKNEMKIELPQYPSIFPNESESGQYEKYEINLAELVKSLTDEQAEFLFNELRNRNNIMIFGHTIMKSELRTEIDCTDEEFEEYCDSNDFENGLSYGETYQENFDRWKECQ